MKNKQPSPNGFRVNVLDGREVSDAEAVKNADNPKLRTGVVNGPHHDAKWARALRAQSPIAPRVVNTAGGGVTVYC